MMWKVQDREYNDYKEGRQPSEMKQQIKSLWLLLPAPAQTLKGALCFLGLNAQNTEATFLLLIFRSWAKV